MTIDELASIVHSPRHVGRLPVGSPVVVFDGETYRNVISVDTADHERFVLVVE